MMMIFQNFPTSCTTLIYIIIISEDGPILPPPSGESRGPPAAFLAEECSPPELIGFIRDPIEDQARMTEHSAYHGLDLPFGGPMIVPALSESIHEALFGDLPLSEGPPSNVPPAELGRVRAREKKRQRKYFGPVELRQLLTVL